MKKLVVFFVLPLLFVGLQVQNTTAQQSVGEWFVSLNIGTQMSGIKSEDFVWSNYSPVVKISAGRWFSHDLALRIGYQGFYYRSISDEKRHHYNYLFGEAVFDLHYIFLGENLNRLWSFHLHGGSGYFLNNSEGQPNIICATIGVSNNVSITDKITINTEVSAVMGWDIYQGDEDILPNISIGISYGF